MSAINIIGSYIFLSLTFLWTLGFWLSCDWLHKRNPIYWGEKKKKHINVRQAQKKFRYCRNTVSFLIFVVFIGSLISAWEFNKHTEEKENRMKRIEEKVTKIEGNIIIPKKDQTIEKEQPVFASPDKLTAEHIQGLTFRLADLLVVGSSTIKGRMFEDCDIYGPAVIFMVKNNAILFCRFPEVPNAESLFITAPRLTWVAGIVGIEACIFRHCTFHNVGFIATPEDKEKYVKGF